MKRKQALQIVNLTMPWLVSTTDVSVFSMELPPLFAGTVQVNVAVVHTAMFGKI
jgi:hypothetical protein